MIILIFFQDFLMIELSIFHPQDQQKCDWLEYRGNKVVQRRFHKHKILCQNPSLFSNHQRKDLSIAIFFVVESYIFHMALYRLFFVRSTHSCINWPKIWQQIVHWHKVKSMYKKTKYKLSACCVHQFVLNVRTKKNNLMYTTCAEPVIFL